MPGNVEHNNRTVPTNDQAIRERRKFKSFVHYMGYRKYKADLLFNGYEMAPSGTVLITKEDGTIEALVPAEEAGDEVKTLHGLLSPGFINTHCHLELSHMKGLIPPGTGLITFLTRVIRERNFQQPEIIAAAEKAENELYESGTSAVGDICNTTDTIGIKKTSRIRWRNFIEVIGFTEAVSASRMDYAGKVLNQFEQHLPMQHAHTSSNLAVSFVPHAPYSVSRSLFELINEASARKIVSIHNQESAAENELYERKTGELFRLYENLGIDPVYFEPSGKSSLQTYLPWLTKASTLILVHNTYISEADIIYAQAKKEHAADLYFCICINANRYIESTNPPLELLRKHQCRITIGTDSLASNHQLNMIDEMKTIHREFPQVPLPEILQWGTLNGAKALGMDDLLGSFTRGKQPGLVLISRLDDGHLTDASLAQRIS